MKQLVYLVVATLVTSTTIMAEPLAPTKPANITRLPPVTGVPGAEAVRASAASTAASPKEGGAAKVIEVPGTQKQQKQMTGKKPPTEVTVENPAEEIPPTKAETVEGLKSRIKVLEDREAIGNQIAESTQRPVNAVSLESKTIYTYLPDAVYLIYGTTNHVVDLQLQPGEKLTGPPAAGDTVRWIVGTASSGSGPEAVTHVLVKPIRTGIETNFLITTDRHAYRIFARSSGNFFIPTVGWVYPQEEMAKASAVHKEEQRIQDLSAGQPVPPEALNFKYRIKPADDYPWTPVRVFDDGARTFIQMNPQMKHSEAPAFFIRDGNELNLVNYRLKGDYFVVDRLFEEGELRSGAKDLVKIVRNRPWFWQAPEEPNSRRGDVPPERPGN